MTNQRYTEGTCADGAGILKDGEMLTIEQVLEDLNKTPTREQEVDEFNEGFYAASAGVSIDDEPCRIKHDMWRVGYSWWWWSEGGADKFPTLEAENAALRATLGMVKKCYTDAMYKYDDLFDYGLQDIMHQIEAPLAVVEGYCQTVDLPHDPWIYDCEDDECIGVFKESSVNTYGSTIDPVTVIIMPKEWTDD